MLLEKIAPYWRTIVSVAMFWLMVLIQLVPWWLSSPMTICLVVGVWYLAYENGQDDAFDPYGDNDELYHRDR